MSVLSGVNVKPEIVEYIFITVDVYKKRSLLHM